MLFLRDGNIEIIVMNDNAAASYCDFIAIYKPQCNITEASLHESDTKTVFGQRHEISNNEVCATSKGSDQPAQTRSLIRAFTSRMNIL